MILAWTLDLSNHDYQISLSSSGIKGILIVHDYNSSACIIGFGNWKLPVGVEDIFPKWLLTNSWCGYCTLFGSIVAETISTPCNVKTRKSNAPSMNTFFPVRSSGKSFRQHFCRVTTAYPVGSSMVIVISPPPSCTRTTVPITAGKTSPVVSGSLQACRIAPKDVPEVSPKLIRLGTSLIPSLKAKTLLCLSHCDSARLTICTIQNRSP